MRDAPRPITLYLAGPIDGISREEGREWREELRPPLNVLLFSPAHAFFNPNKMVAREMDHLLKHVIACCDGVIANLSGPGRGIGTIREIEYARLGNKPVAVCCDKEFEKSLMTYDLMCFRSVDECLDGLLQSVYDGRNTPSPFGLMIQLPGMEPPEDEA